MRRYRIFRIKEKGFGLKNIDCILISHFHGDHYGGLLFLLLEAAKIKRIKPLTIISPPGCRKKTEALLPLLYPGNEALNSLPLDFKSYSSDQYIRWKHLNILPVAVNHVKEALPHGLRIETGSKILSYSGDTEWTPALKKIAQDADLFLCECTFYKKEIKGHLNYSLLR